MEDKNRADRLNWIFAGLVTLFSFIIYYKTMAVSVSLWDCGEFIACARIFGIAHPPGTPLFVIFGRIMSLIPFSPDIAHRVTMVSVFSSAFTIGFSYLAISKIVSWWIKEKDTFWQKLPMYLGGIVGSLMMAFSRTYWTNAVEAEVYGLTMLVSIVIIYLALIWYEKRDDPSSDKYIFLMVFLGILGSAAHLAAYLVMPAVFLFIMISSKRLLKQPLVWLSFICAGILMYHTIIFIYWLLIWLGVTFLGVLFSRNYWWKWAFAFTLLLAIGFSLQYTTLVRAQHRPRINMTNANSWDRMNDYLARSQYGQGNMITRMFTRRGELSNQFGDYPRMGMLGFWKDQYSPSYLPFVIWLFLGLWGLYYAVKLRWKIGLLILLLVVISTIGITLYMNFADGTQVNEIPNNKIEVRDRDYFWTHGFALFGWAIGLGVSSLLLMLTEFFKSRENLKKLIIPVSAVFCITIFLPGFGIAKNYYYNNRSGEWFPYQFATDMLNTCKENAVLFTAGDNDTYPLWCLQEAYGFRQDVKIINLALANVDWYVLHTKEILGAPMALERDQIKVNSYESPSGEILRPEKPYYDRFSGKPMYFGSRPIYDPQTRQQVGLIEQAQLVVEKVIEKSLIERGDTMILRTPIYFSSITEPVQGVRYNELMKYLEKDASLYKIKDTIIKGETEQASPLTLFTYDVDKNYKLFNEVFTYDGMKDFEYARGEFTTMMGYRYYANQYKILIDSLKSRNDTTRLINTLETAVNTTPEYSKYPEWKYMLDSLRGVEGTNLAQYQREYIDYMRELLSYHPYNMYYKQFISEVLLEFGKSEGGNQDYIKESLEYLETGYTGSPESEWMLQGLISGNVTIGDTNRLVEIFLRYRKQNPDEYFRPMFLLAADYIDEKRTEDLGILLRGYFRAFGQDRMVFRELIRYGLMKSDADATAVIQTSYFAENPNDTEAYEFLRQLFMMPEDSANQ